MACGDKNNQKDLISKLIDVPSVRPGFDALHMSSPVMVQLNPDGKWENSKPETLDENALKSLVQYLVDSKAITAAQSYCSQCAVDCKNQGGPSNYIPVIMMPIYPADQCPFDIDAETQKLKHCDKNKIKDKATGKIEEDNISTKKGKDKAIKPTFIMQRLTDFDLLSQW